MDDFARVKAAVNIVDVVSQKVALKKKGTRYVGLCPFHAEKTPSFGVVPDGQYFKCFGCGKGGDVFVFVQETDRVEPREALRILADQAGVELTTPDPRARERRQKQDSLREVMEQAQRLFVAALDSTPGQQVVKELEGRGISVPTQRDFGLGYALPSTGRLAMTMRKQGASPDTLDEAGLVYVRGSEVRDVFRDRIMIPIRDERGRVISFGARRRHDGPGAPEPKYRNSKDNPLFHKSRVLYGMDLARKAVIEREQAVLVEGYMDVIMAHQAGVKNTVAALGTSVTEDHAKALSRVAREVLLFLDGDEAGRRAARRAVPLLLAAGLQVRVVGLPEGEDPGDFFEAGRGPDEFEELCKSAGLGALDFLLEVHGAAEARSYDHKINVARALIEELTPVRDTLVRAAAVQHVSRELDLPVDALRKQLGRARAARRPAPPTGPIDVDPEEQDVELGSTSAPEEHSARLVAEQELLIALLREPDLRDVAAELVPEGAISHPFRKRLFSALVADCSAEVGDLLARFSGEKEAQQILLDLVERPVHADPGKLFDGAIQFFERERKVEQRRLLQQRHMGALRRGDSRGQLDYLSEYQASLHKKQGR